MNSTSGIILGGDEGISNFSGSPNFSPYRSPTKTREGIPLAPTTFKGTTDEGIPLLEEPKGNSQVPLSINLPPPPAITPTSKVVSSPKVTNTTSMKQQEEVSFYLPWSDRVMAGEDPKVYQTRNRMGLELVLVYDIIVSVLFVVAYLRYRKDNYFWTIFAVSMVWAVFGSFSIWYGTLNGDLTVGIILTVVFPLLLFAYGLVTLEPRHRLYDKYSHLAQSYK